MSSICLRGKREGGSSDDDDDDDDDDDRVARKDAVAVVVQSTILGNNRLSLQPIPSLPPSLTYLLICHPSAVFPDSSSHPFLNPALVASHLTATPNPPSHEPQPQQDTPPSRVGGFFKRDPCAGFASGGSWMAEWVEAKRGLCKETSECMMAGKGQGSTGSSQERNVCVISRTDVRWESFHYSFFVLCMAKECRSSASVNQHFTTYP